MNRSAPTPPLRRVAQRHAAAILFALFGAQWLLFSSLNVPTWDGVFYYAYARSAVFDGDLHFANDIRAAYPTAGDHFPTRALDGDLTATGYVNNVFAPGTAAVWLPWVALARGAAGLLGVPVSGYEWPFVRVLAALSMLAGLTAFWLGYRLTAPLVGRTAALLATVTLMCATPLLYYQFRDPFYSHPAASLAVALLLTAWWSRHAAIDQPRTGFLIGALIGLAALVRWQYAIYGVLPLLSAASWLWSSRATPPRAFRTATRYLLTVAAGAALPLSIQLAIWHTLYGTWLTIPQGDGFMTWDLAYLGPLLLSPFRGLLAWMPVFFPALAGLVWLARRRPALGVPLLIVLLLQLYVNSSLPDWFAGGGYGPRRFTGETVILVIGYGYLLAQIAPRARAAVGLTAALLLAWQQAALLRYALADRLGGAVQSMAPDFRWAQSDWPTFAAALLARMARAVTQPADFWRFDGSPLSLLLSGHAPWQHVSGLLLALLLWLALAWSARRLAALRPAVVIALTVAAVVLIDLWVLFIA